MKISIICVGKLKEKYWRDATSEYCKRLTKYCTLEINEIKEEKAPENLSKAEESMVKEVEGKNILKQIKKDAYVIVLEIKGIDLTSEELSDKINGLALGGKSEIAFVIGGSLGLSEEVLTRADYKLSFSRMTFPHQMMRVILLEQIYRGFKILKNEPYHK